MTFSKKNLAFVQVQGHLIHFEIVQYLKRGHKWKRLKGYMTYGFRANYNCDKNVTMEMNPSLIACHLQHQCLSHSEITKSRERVENTSNILPHSCMQFMQAAIYI